VQNRLKTAFEMRASMRWAGSPALPSAETPRDGRSEPCPVARGHEIFRAGTSIVPQVGFNSDIWFLPRHLLPRANRAHAGRYSQR